MAYLTLSPHSSPLQGEARLREVVLLPKPTQLVCGRGIIISQDLGAGEHAAVVTRLGAEVRSWVHLAGLRRKAASRKVFILLP